MLRLQFCIWLIVLATFSVVSTDDKAAELHEDSHEDHNDFSFMDFFGDENTEDDA